MSEVLTACGPMCDRQHTEHERHNANLATQATVVDLFASVIAESRYNAWDSHAQPPNSMTWQEYRAAEPSIACNIYLFDGRRDAEALLPYVRDALKGAAVKALREAAAELKASGDLKAATTVLEHAARIDLRKENDG